MDLITDTSAARMTICDPVLFPGGEYLLKSFAGLSQRIEMLPVAFVGYTACPAVVLVRDRGSIRRVSRDCLSETNPQNKNGSIPLENNQPTDPAAHHEGLRA